MCDAERKTLVTVVGPQTRKNLLQQLLPMRADLSAAEGFSTGQYQSKLELGNASVRDEVGAQLGFSVWSVGKELKILTLI